MRFTLNAFLKKFPDDEACLDYIFKKLTVNQDKCVKCDKQFRYHRVTNRKFYECSCGHQISPLANTIFHKSKTSLRDWFYVIFLFASSKNGVAAKEVERQLGVTYKCAWRICKQIRLLLQDNITGLTGIIEMDETYIGGKEKNKHANKKTKNTQGRSVEVKTPIIGMIEKQGNVIAKVTDNAKAKTINSILTSHVKISTEIHTDEYKGYNKVSKLGYVHKKVNHGNGVYVVAHVHTNTIEGFWSQLKRSVNGTYHNVSKKYLQNYVNEFSFRYNRRKSDIPMFNSMLDKVQKYA